MCQMSKYGNSLTSYGFVLQVMKTGKCIDVRQDNPYNDIFLLETPVLRQLFEPEGGAQL